jgi:hypothetical protein
MAPGTPNTRKVQVIGQQTRRTFPRRDNLGTKGMRAITVVPLALERISNLPPN